MIISETRSLTDAPRYSHDPFADDSHDGRVRMQLTWVNPDGRNTKRTRDCVVMSLSYTANRPYWYVAECLFAMRQMRVSTHRKGMRGGYFEEEYRAALAMMGFSMWPVRPQYNRMSFAWFLESNNGASLVLTSGHLIGAVDHFSYERSTSARRVVKGVWRIEGEYLAMAAG